MPQLMGFEIEDVTLDEAVSGLMDLMRSGCAYHVSFVNAHYANVAARDSAYRSALRGAHRLFADGSGMRLAGRLFGVTLKDNVNGTDLFPPLVQAMSEAGMRVFLLGGRPGVAERVRRWMERTGPGLVVCGVRHGYVSPEAREELQREIRQARPDLLLVGMGAPHQDVWISENIEALQVPVAMAVGGLFDFYSGSVPRAPGWIRALGIEWTFRLLMEPRRLWKRYLVGNATFMARAAWAGVSLPGLEGGR
jgi:N-acetylglucosaminyldiphosphoundecaprenol N-acetyl-beta-D-mannosaminyltransferase